MNKLLFFLFIIFFDKNSLCPFDRKFFYKKPHKNFCKNYFHRNLNNRGKRFILTSNKNYFARKISISSPSKRNKR